MIRALASETWHIAVLTAEVILAGLLPLLPAFILVGNYATLKAALPPPLADVLVGALIVGGAAAGLTLGIRLAEGAQT